MSTYKKAGVDVDTGDLCSAIASSFAKKTFDVRKGMRGTPVLLEDGFTGALDMGDYYLVQNSDGVGSKIEIARLMGKYDTLGYDLLAMVADDAVCVGAEVISIVDTIDTERVDEQVTRELMKGLAQACCEQKIVIAGGEIAELPSLVKGTTWNAAAIGIVEKSKFIDGKKIKKGDAIFGLESPGFRSNGFTLVRYILEKKFGKNWYRKPFDRAKTWGEVTLTPSLIYHRCILDMIGGFREKSTVDLHGIVHVTGGGIYNNIQRVLHDRKAHFDQLPKPPEAMLRLMEIGKVSEKEAYKTWNMGLGMLLICPEKEGKKMDGFLKKYRIRSQRVGFIL